MIVTRKSAAALLAVLAGAAAVVYSVRAQSQPQIPMPAQQPAPLATPQMNHNLIVLDPAHGGPDAGATLGNVPEKNVTLAFAAKLRAALAAANFTVATTRDADVSDPLTTDARAEAANRTHAVACIVLHATAAGSGVHVYTSGVQPAAQDISFGAPFAPIPWDEAQAGFVLQSRRLAADLNAALAKDTFPVLNGQAPLRPLDSLMCPAVAVEIAPLQVSGGDTTAVTDADYQQRIVATLVTALQTWRTQVDSDAAQAGPQ